MAGGDFDGELMCACCDTHLMPRSDYEGDAGFSLEQGFSEHENLKTPDQFGVDALMRMFR